jgi:hypothetical protein
MHFTDWQFLGAHWLWCVAAAAGMLFVWSLTPVKLPSAGRRRREGTATLAIHSLLWVHPPGDIAKLLQQSPGVRVAELDLARGTARVSFDPQETSAVRLQDFVENCAHHCRGERAAHHSCPVELNNR